MTKLPKLVFFGNERLATGVTTKAPVLNALIQAGYEIAALVISQGDTVSRNKRELEVVHIADAHDIPVLRPKNLIEIKDELNKMKAEAGILVAFGQIVPQAIIDIFPAGIINIHPSLLPVYRGSSPIEQAILAESETGVSLMALTAKMDAGPIYAQAKLAPDYSRTSKAELTDKLNELGADLLINNLSRILDGSLQPKPQAGFEEPQNEQTMVFSYTPRISKDAGNIDFSRMQAPYIERQVRAYAGWPKSRAKVFGKDIIVTKTRVARDKDDGDLVMECRLGWLEIIELTGPSGRSMSGADFIRGYKKA